MGFTPTKLERHCGMIVLVGGENMKLHGWDDGLKNQDLITKSTADSRI